MSPGRVAVIVSKQSPVWISCQSISANLRRSYSQLPDSSTAFFHCPVDASRIAVLELARKISAWQPTTVVFLDHLPHPAPLVLALDTVLGASPRPRIVFHVYGDFTLYPFQWMSLDLLLRRYEVAFITASPRQTALVSNFLKPGSATVFTAAFPVDATMFKPSAKLRAATRKRLRLSRGTQALVYTGRISVQKNVSQLIGILGGMMSRLRPNHLQLFIAGPADDLGVPLFQKSPYDLGYRTQLEAQLKALPGHIRHRIRLLGNLGSSELAALYNAADIFVSPSLHHDEDFGMSPAEALMCGVPAVLTDWGGYGQFLGHDADGYRVPVELDGRGLHFNSKFLEKALLTLCFSEETFKTREQRGARFAARYSVDALSARLADIHAGAFAEFHGFSPLMRDLREAHRGGKAPFPRGPKKGTFYEKVYSAYLA